jgi:transcriptional regulator with XRE-family HTH domain
MTPKEQGAAIRAARLALDYSQAQLCVLIGLPPKGKGSISRWECGRSLPTASSATALEDVLGIDIALTREPGRPQVRPKRGMPARSDLGRRLGLIVGVDPRKAELVVATADRFERACELFDKHCKES